MLSVSAKTFRAVLLCSVAALAVLSGCKKAPPTLSLLVWEGYADPSFIQGFEAKCQCKVTAAYMGSSDELVAKLRGGASSNYDVISPSSDVATSLSRSGLVAPLDLSKIPNYAQLSPNLTSRTLVKQDGKVYGVPLTWGPNPLLYDTTAFAKAPATWAELWDPKFANKLSFWDDLSTMYMAAEVLGFGKTDPAAVYNLNDAQLEQVKQKLIALKPNIRKLWTTGGELTNLFQNHEVIAGMGWPLVTNQLHKSGLPIQEEIPAEGHHRVDRPPDDYLFQRKQGTCLSVIELPHLRPGAETAQRCYGIYSGQPASRRVDDARAAPQPAPGRYRCLPAPDCLLAGCAAAREIHRDMERSKGQPVKGWV